MYVQFESGSVRLLQKNCLTYDQDGVLYTKLIYLAVEQIYLENVTYCYSNDSGGTN